MLEADEPPPERRNLRKLLVTGLGSLLVTALLIYLALWLGAWGFDTRRFGQHEARLERLLVKRPYLDQVVGAFADEGTLLVGSPADRGELARIVAERAGPRAAEVMRKGARWPLTRVFEAGDMVYFVYFDTDGLMRDFTCASR